MSPQILAAARGQAGIVPDMFVDTNRDLLSVGRLSELLQASPGAIERAAVAAGIPVTLRIDGRPYFSDADVTRFRDVLSKPEPQA